MGSAAFPGSNILVIGRVDRPVFKVLFQFGHFGLGYVSFRCNRRADATENAEMTQLHHVTNLLSLEVYSRRGSIDPALLASIRYEKWVENFRQKLE
jgi:hypothetical protein